MDWACLQQSSIVLDLESRTKSPAIRELIRRSGAFADLRGTEALEQSVLSREKVMSTGIGRGVAIAHGEDSQLPGVRVALGISKEGIDFDALDGKPVHILFLVANSKLRRGHYLEVLRDLTKIMRLDSARDKLRCCDCGSEVEETLRTALQQLLRTA